MSKTLDQIVAGIPDRRIRRRAGSAIDRALAALPDKRARDDRDPNQSDLDAAARAAKRRMGHRDAALRRDKHHRALDAILARIPGGRRTQDAFAKWDVVVEKKEGGDKRTISVKADNDADAKRFALEGLGDQNAGKYTAKSATRAADRAIDRTLRTIPDHRRPARRDADRLRRGLGLDSILSKSDARAILREYHAGSKKRLQDLARELKLDERAALAWVLKEAESGKDARDASYLVTAKFADNSTFRQIYQDASEAEAKYADLAADPKVVDCDIQDYEGTPEFEVGDALTEADALDRVLAAIPNRKRRV